MAEGGKSWLTNISGGILRYGACRSPAQNRLLDEIRNEIRRVPSADVTEVVQGQWEGEGDGYADGEIVLDVWYCSQ